MQHPGMRIGTESCGCVAQLEPCQGWFREVARVREAGRGCCDCWHLGPRAEGAGRHRVCRAARGRRQVQGSFPHIVSHDFYAMPIIDILLAAPGGQGIRRRGVCEGDIREHPPCARSGSDICSAARLLLMFTRRFLARLLRSTLPSMVSLHSSSSWVEMIERGAEVYVRLGKTVGCLAFEDGA
eukprot:2154101-Rhodomonas_salina.4